MPTKLDEFFYELGVRRGPLHVIPDLNAVVIITGGSYWITPATHPDIIMDNYIIPALR